MAEDDTPIDSGTDAPAEPSLHDTISDAFDTVETRDAPPPGATPPPEAPPPAGATPAPGERARGPDGKFVAADAPAKPSAAPSKPEAAPGASKPLQAPQQPKDAPKAPPLDPAAAAAPQTRAPASWKPGAREHWAKLPAEVQQEVTRRETEVARTMQESHQARQALTHVQGVIGPFAHNFQAAGKDALSAMQDLFKADNTLRHGSIQEKAALAADIIKSYGVDITALDAILAGQTPEIDPNAALAEKLRREMQQQLAPVMQHFSRMQGARQSAMQQISTDAAGEVSTFATDGQHEFFDDVRADMADIIDLFTARGATITLQDAYERAIRINPQVSDIVAKRAEAARVNNAAAAAQRAKRTAASIGGSPAPAGAGPGPAGDDRRGSIEAAWDAASGS